MRKCCVSSCETSSKNKSQDIAFHRIPKKYDKQKWIKMVAQKYWNPGCNTFICSKHFEEQFLDRSGQSIKLIDGAYPTLFMRGDKTNWNNKSVALDHTYAANLPMPRKCSVPLCKSNYNNGRTEFSTFCFPKEPELADKWLKAVHRKDFVPTKHSCVCILHFEERFIEREMTAIRDDGSELVVPLSRPRLKKNAHPTIFPKQPSYHTATVPQEQRDPDERHQVDKEMMTNSVDRENQPILTQMQEEENENVPSWEDTFIPMEIKIETFEEPSNDLLGQERMVIVDIVKSIMCSLDLLVKSDPDILRSTSVKIKITEALFCYRHIVDDKDLNLALCKESDIFNNDHQPPNEVVTVVKVEPKEEILDEDISNEDFKEEFSNYKENPEWESKDNIDEKSKNSINKLSVSKIKGLVETYKNREHNKTDQGKKESNTMHSVKKTPKKRESKQNTSVEATGSLVEFKVNEEVKMDVVLFVSAIPRFVCQICDVTLVSEHHLAVHKLLCRIRHFYYGNPKLEDFWNDLKCPLCDIKCNLRGNLGRHYITHRVMDIESAFAPLKEKHLNPNNAEHNIRLLNDFISEFERLDEKNEQQFNSLPSNQQNAHITVKKNMDNEESDNSVEHKKQTKKISHYLKFNLKKIVYDIDFDKGLYCNSCDMLFNSKDELDVHKKKVNDTDTFVCNHCDETFAIPTKLINHVKTHTGLYNPNSLYHNNKMEDLELCPRQLDYRIYACKYCLEMFVQEVSLQSHMEYYTKNRKCCKKNRIGHSQATQYLHKEIKRQKITM